jgi:hypothetical protein
MMDMGERRRELQYSSTVVEGKQRSEGSPRLQIPIYQIIWSCDTPFSRPNEFGEYYNDYNT